MNRRNFLKLGSLFVPMVAAPTVAYSFLWARPKWDPVLDARPVHGVLRHALRLEIDGERVVDGSRYLLTGHQFPSQNGVWEMRGGTWRRAADVFE